MKRVRLTSEEHAFLADAEFLPQSLREVVAADLSQPVGAHELVVHGAVIEELREALTERLASSGFDAAYQLTPEGEMLERLIDVLASGT